MILEILIGAIIGAAIGASDDNENKDSKSKKEPKEKINLDNIVGYKSPFGLEGFEYNPRTDSYFKKESKEKNKSLEYNYGSVLGNSFSLYPKKEGKEIVSDDSEYLSLIGKKFYNQEVYGPSPKVELCYSVKDYGSKSSDSHLIKMSKDFIRQESGISLPALSNDGICLKIK